MITHVCFVRDVASHDAIRCNKKKAIRRCNKKRCRVPWCNKISRAVAFTLIIRGVPKVSGPQWSQWCDVASSHICALYVISRDTTSHVMSRDTTSRVMSHDATSHHCDHSRHICVRCVCVKCGRGQIKVRRHIQSTYVWGVYPHPTLVESFIWVTRLIHTRDTIPSNVWHDSFICVNGSFWFVTWIICMCDMAWRASFIHVTWLIHMCDVTHAYVWHHSFICVPSRIHMSHTTTHSHVWQDSFIRVTGPICMCDMTHSCVWHDSYVRATWLIHVRFVIILYVAPHTYHTHTHTHKRTHTHLHTLVSYLQVQDLIKNAHKHTRHAHTHMYICTHRRMCTHIHTHTHTHTQTHMHTMSCDTLMGWLRLVGSLKW